MMDHPWFKSYPTGTAHQVSFDEYRSLADFFEDSFRKFSHKTAFILMGTRLSYTQLDKQSQAFASWLQQQGMQKGDRVALVMPNVLQYPICMIGALRAGCVVVNCNPLYTPNELIHQLNDSQARVVVSLHNFAHTLEKTLPSTPSVQTVVMSSVGDCLGTVKGRVVDWVIKAKKLIPQHNFHAFIPFKTVIKQGQQQAFKPVEITHDDLAYLQYTGGTTGIAKGAMLTHANILANCTQAYEWCRSYLTPAHERVVTALPLYHIFALTANCFLFLKLGAENLLIINPRDIKGFLFDLKRFPPTVITGVNTLFNALAHNKTFKTLDFSKLRFTLGGGMMVQKAVADLWQQTTGVIITQAYGLTETSPAATINRFDLPTFSASIGLPIPSTLVSIRDDQGKDLSLGQTGEICIKGPQVMKGYWHRPEETQAVFYPDGYLRTGDMGYMDDNGYVFLVDRKKDVIIVSGFNVYPNEIEDVVAKHPDILESVAVGVPCGISGELIRLYAIRKQNTVTEEALRQFCRQSLTPYKVPKQVVFVEELPKNNVGKILRRQLRDQARQEPRPNQC